MRVLFIYPNLYCQVGFNYGVAYLSAVLKEAGHETRLINLDEKLGYGLDYDRLRKDVRDYDPGIIGFSTMTNQYQFVREIAAFLKREFPEIPIICGGVHAMMVPEKTIEEPFFDFVCKAEGEGAMLDLVEALERGEEPHGILNILSKKDGEVITPPLRPFQDLSVLPDKDYSLYDFQQMIDAKNGWVGLMASRGCPYRCTYCFNHKIVDMYREDAVGKGPKYLRHHPVEQMMREIDYLLTHYKRIEMFIFDDDLFTLNRDYLMAFCTAYKKRFKTPFVVNAHIKVFDAIEARYLKEAGCAMVKFGLESGSERVRKEVMYRYMKNEEIERAFRLAEEYDLDTSAFVMFGLPSESLAEVWETVDLLATAKPTRFRWSIFFPYVGTKAYEMAEREGLIDRDLLGKLTDFVSESSLTFDDEAFNLFLEKLQRCLPWYVNARSDFDSAPFYKMLVDEIEAMSQAEWDAIKDDVIPLEKRLQKIMGVREREGYEIKYNDFMAVRRRRKQRAFKDGLDSEAQGHSDKVFGADKPEIGAGAGENGNVGESGGVF